MVGLSWWEISRILWLMIVAVLLGLMTGRALAGSPVHEPLVGGDQLFDRVIRNANQFIYSGYTSGTLAKEETCRAGENLFDYSAWVNSPKWISADQACRIPNVSATFSNLGQTLVQTSNDLIWAKGWKLLDHAEWQIKYHLSRQMNRPELVAPYLELRSYLQKMLARPLIGFQRTGLVRPIRCELGEKCQKFEVEVLLTADLIGKLEQLKVEPETLAELRNLSLAKYTLTVLEDSSRPVALMSDLELEYPELVAEAIKKGMAERKKGM